MLLCLLLSTPVELLINVLLASLATAWRFNVCTVVPCLMDAGNHVLFARYKIRSEGLSGEQ